MNYPIAFTRAATRVKIRVKQYALVLTAVDSTTVRSRGRERWVTRPHIGA